jgi:hypothetical protein
MRWMLQLGRDAQTCKTDKQLSSRITAAIYETNIRQNIIVIYMYKVFY